MTSFFLKFNIIVISSILLFMGCSEHPFNSELEEIQELQLTLDSARNVFNSIRLEDVVITKSNIEADRNELIRYINNNPDSLTTQIGTLIDVLRTSLKKLNKIETNQANIKNELGISTIQIKSLRNDLKHNVLKTSDAEKYMNEERLAITSLKKSVDQMKHNSYIGVLKYEQNKILIDSLKQLAN